MMDVLLDIALFLLVLSIPILLFCLLCKEVIRKERISWRKRYDSIQIGDRFIQKLNQPDPFKRQYADIVEVKDKAMTSDGGMYLLYNSVSDIIGYQRSCSIQDFFDSYHYVPYNNQDKQS